MGIIDRNAKYPELGYQTEGFESRKKIMDYKTAGVDIEAGDKFAEYIQRTANLSNQFSSVFEIDLSKYSEPIIATTTDGVGSKDMVAKYFNKFDTLGIDLVAMVVNDLLANGATPVQFLDYLAVGKIGKLTEELMKGIIKGCEIAEVELVGGETAEMPDKYSHEDFDMAGFGVGIVEKKDLLPKKELIKKGDVILGIPSSGIHCNGLTLARKVVSKEYWDRLLIPTRIYTEQMKLVKNHIVAAAHITGGGLFGNIRRVLPEGLDFEIYLNKAKMPKVFKLIREEGSISDEEMIKVFNIGIGMALIVKEENVEIVKDKLKDIKHIGDII